MMDLVYLGLIIAFCVVSAALVYGFERLRSRP